MNRAILTISLIMTRALTWAQAIDSSAHQKGIEGYEYIEKAPQRSSSNKDWTWLDSMEQLLEIIGYFFIAAFIVAIIWVIVKVVQSHQPNQKVQIAYQENKKAQEINGTRELEEALERALAEKNKKEIIRLQTLIVLIRLKQNNRLRWTPELTNKEILRSFAKDSDYEALSQMLRIYEMAWFAELPVLESWLSESSQRYAQFKSGSDEK